MTNDEFKFCWFRRPFIKFHIHIRSQFFTVLWVFPFSYISKCGRSFILFVHATTALEDTTAVKENAVHTLRFLNLVVWLKSTSFGDTDIIWLSLEYGLYSLVNKRFAAIIQIRFCTIKKCLRWYLNITPLLILLYYPSIEFRLNVFYLY